jgi:hypothetical protein
MSNQIETPLLSVIVPTRNRAQYAIACIQGLVRISSPCLEVIVQDNSDNCELRDFVEREIDDPRFHYRAIAERLDVIRNFNSAMELASGTYITYLGDDDGVHHEIMDAAAWAHSQDIDCVITTRPAQYWWPDVRFRYFGDRLAGALEIAPFTGRLSYVDPEKELWKCARASAGGIGDLPRAYYGLVKRDCMERLRESTGAYCRVSPDMSSSVGLASTVRRIAKIDYPIFLPGSSAKSTAGMGVRKQHVGNLEDQPHLPKECLEHWSKEVPRFFSASTIWAEACIQTLRAIHREDVLDEFNWPLLHASCRVFNPDWSSFCLEHYRRVAPQLGMTTLGSATWLAAGHLQIWGSRAKSLVRNIVKFYGRSRTATLFDVPDVAAGMKELDDYIAARRLSLKHILGNIPATSPEPMRNSLQHLDAVNAA